VIIDAHVHIVDKVEGLTGAGPTRSLGYGKISWGSRELQLLTPSANPTSFSPETLLAYMDWAGVDKAVLLQGGFYGDKNDYVASAVARWPDRLVGAGYFDPCAAGAEEAFRRCVDELGFWILKFELSVETGLVGLHPDLRLDGERMAWIWYEAERRDLVVAVDLGAVGSASYQTDALRSVLDRHPRLRVVIAHLAQPPIATVGDPELDALWEAQLRLARRPTVWLDLSSLAAYAATIEEYPYPTAQSCIRRAVELLGADRLLWGSDLPGLLSVATYPQLLAFVARRCDFLDAHDRARILGLNAEDVYFAR
jgi:predicted TIM-barrel fold metal-dependent hydrolase